MEVEPLKEEKARLESELRASTRELGDILFSNDELIKENREKELLAASREEYVTVLIEKNQAELLQIKSEKEAMVEKCNHDLAVKENGLEQLENFAERFMFMKDENTKLEKEIANITKIATEERFAFADQMHQMNKVMREKRQNLESSLKRELNDMDLSCQFNAFSNLDEKKKKEMLTNAKLKDELAIQSIGISNLGARLSRQTAVCESTKRKMVKMEQKAEMLRDRLSDFRMKEMARAKKTKLLQEEEKKLKEVISKLLRDNEEAEAGTNKTDLYQTFMKLQEKKLNVQKWENRLAALKRLHTDLMLPLPVNIVDGRHFSSSIHVKDISMVKGNAISTVSVNDGPSTVSESGTAASTVTMSVAIPRSSASSSAASSAQVSARAPLCDAIVNTQSLVGEINTIPDRMIMTLQKLRDAKQDLESEGFTEMVAPLRGREASILLNNGVATMDNNAIAWVVHELIRVWRETEKTFNDGFAHLKKNLTKHHYIDTVSPMRTAPMTRQSTMPFLLGDQEHAQMSIVHQAHSSGNSPTSALLRPSSFGFGFDTSSHASVQSSRISSGTSSPMTTTTTANNNNNNNKRPSIVRDADGGGTRSRTESGGVGSGSGIGHNSGTVTPSHAAAAAGMGRLRSPSFRMNELQAQRVMQKFGDEESDLTERDMEELWDQIHLDAEMTKQLQQSEEAAAAAGATLWLKKNNIVQSHFVEHLGCSATVSSVLQRNDEVRRSHGHIKSNDNNNKEEEDYDPETGIDVRKYRFTSTIIGGGDLLPPAAAKSKNKHVPEVSTSTMRSSSAKATVSGFAFSSAAEATTTMPGSLSASTLKIKVPKKSRVAQAVAMSKTDSLMLKQHKQVGISGAASLSRMPLTSNPFTKHPKEDLEAVAVRSIGVTLRKTQTQLNKKIDKLRCSLSEANLINLPPISLENKM